MVFLSIKIDVIMSAATHKLRHGLKCWLVCQMITSVLVMQAPCSACLKGTFVWLGMFCGAVAYLAGALGVFTRVGFDLVIAFLRVI